MWKTLVVFGQGSGGTFYQAFDATLDGMGATVSPDSDNVSSLLSYFNNTSRIPFLWSFPRYSMFDVTLGSVRRHLGVGHRPREVRGPDVVRPGRRSGEDEPQQVHRHRRLGLLPAFVRGRPRNRAGASAGRSLYLLNAEDGTVFDRKESTPSNDSLAEADDNCVRRRTAARR